MTFTLTIEMDNAAFEASEDDRRSGTELAAILKRAAGMVNDEELQDGWYQTFRDSNGNRVGEAKVSE